MAAPDTGLLSPGKTFHGHYEVVRCLSTGAMGAVYEVLDLKTHRRRALKVMLPSLVSNQEMRERFRLEATITADIVSEHIVETFDADVDAETGAPFLVMELLRGDDLANVLADRGKLNPSEIVLVLSQAARALDKTHAAGIVHRDLKPENLFITNRDDGTPRVKILDFGIAKVLAANGHTGIKQQTINLGTPPYMSPEQVMGEGSIDHRADIYALGHMAYALLVGEPYWLEEGRQLASLYTLLLRICEGAKEAPSVRASRYGVALPPAFDVWFARATAPSPAMRFNRASELVISLAEVFGVPLETRSISTTGGDWELDSIQLTQTAVMRLKGGLVQAVPSRPAESSRGGGQPPPMVVPPMPPPPSFSPHAGQPKHLYGASTAGMATPAKPRQKKSRLRTALAVLLVAFLVGLGAAALMLRLSGGPDLTEGVVESGTRRVAQGNAVSGLPTTTPAPSARASSEVAAAASATAPVDTVLPAGADTGKTGSSAGSLSSPTSTATRKTRAGGTKAGTTTKKAGTYDPLRDL